jgi:NAD(P)-dependent dehydrogenase (short-subunit alcohol dehydrogenase family)
MRVDLSGRSAAVAGSKGELATAIIALLGANGAVVRSMNSAADVLRLEHLDLIVNVAIDARDPDLLEGLCRSAADRMAPCGGHILNIVSALGAVPVRGEIGASVAAAAIMMLTRALALEFGERRILVNALVVGALGDGRLAKRMLTHIPLGRCGNIDEIARAALFLVDPENTYMTGHAMLVDGGWTAGYAREF